MTVGPIGREEAVLGGKIVVVLKQAELGLPIAALIERTTISMQNLYCWTSGS